MGLIDQLKRPLFRAREPLFRGRELEPRGQLLADAGWMLIAGLPGVLLGVLAMGTWWEPTISFSSGLALLFGLFMASAGALCLAYEVVTRGGRVSSGIGVGLTTVAGSVLLALVTLPALGIYRVAGGAPSLLPFELEPASLSALAGGLGEGALIVGGILFWMGISSAAAALRDVDGWPVWVSRIAPMPGWFAMGCLLILLLGGTGDFGFPLYMVATGLGSVTGFALGVASVRMGRALPARSTWEEVPAGFEAG